MKGSNRAPRITALMCENSAWKAYLDARDDPALGSVEAVRLPCTGRVDAALLLRLLENGSRGVLVLGCPKDSCEYMRGSHRAEKRVGAARAALREAGIPEERLHMDFLSAVDGRRLPAIVRSFLEGLDGASASAAAASTRQAPSAKGSS